MSPKGYFASSTGYGKRLDTFEELKERFVDNVTRISALVFNNGKECKAYRKDFNKMLFEAKIDLICFDPPYINESLGKDCEYSLHFIEWLTNRWADKELLDDNRRSYKLRTHCDHENIRVLIEK